MQITQVEYRRLRSFGSYENETIGAVTAVGPEGPEATMEKLKDWVHGQLNEAVMSREEKSELWSQIRHARAELREVNENLDEAKARWERAKEFLAKHGVSIDFEQEMPF